MRHWKTVSTSFATLCARLSTTAGNLIINGIAYRHMTSEQFGLWSILYSINLLTNGLDFGFRFTLGNRLAALGSGGPAAEEERRETFLAIFFLQAAIAVAAIAIISILFPVLPWAHWFQISDPLLVIQIRGLMPIVVMLMVGTLPLALMWTVFFAYHEIKLASFLGGLCTLLQTAVFVVSAYLFDFTWVMFIYFATSLAVGTVLTSYVFIRRKWKFTLLPLSRIFAIIGSLSRVSSHAFFNTLSSIISQILGPIVSGATSGLAAAGIFTLIQKLFSFLITAHLALLAPVAPAVTLESHSGNWDAVRRRLRVCVLQVWPAVFLLLGAMVWFGHPLLIRLWTGNWLRRYHLAALLLVWACFAGFINTFSVFLNSLGLVKMQAVVSFAMILPSMILPVVLSHRFGVQGIALSMVLCSIPGVIIWPLYTRRALRLRLLRV